VSDAIVPANAKAKNGKEEDAFHLDTKAVCANQGIDGTKGLAVGNGSSTAGTAGKDYEVHIGVFFAGSGAYFEDAPNGNYSATVTITITD
jgi:hypothetical protein